ncbi:MAG: restriction endonuclease subunit S [Veillonella sp.]|uniref:restriction endonuclease subunit S n=1 Tax=Veillonella sp. TaxID=1926307 RepID=UPI002915AB9A|nr:restriction endonuclease subunit S [Veillonella sp.]MDU5764028.1 restriction endonuclease subunit S [Veillonella sp.]
MKYKLGEIVDVIMGQSPKSEFYNTEGKGYPFLQGNRTFGLKYPTFDIYTTVLTKLAKAGDIIMSVRAPVGDLNITPVDMCLGRGVCSLKMKNGNQSYLFYMMKYYIPHLLQKESGTVFGSVSKRDITELEVDIIEDVEKQNKIARYLEMIDDKIELNNAINNNLEQQAQAIFKSWFIDFDPFDGIRPSDWIIGTIDNLGSEIICGKTPSTKKKEYYGSDMPFITIPDMHGCVYNVVTEKYLSIAGIASQSKKTLPPNSVCVSCIGTAGLVTLVSEKSQSNQQINAITPKEGISPYYVYLLMKTLSKIINKLGQSGSTIVNLNKKQFSKIQVIIPSRSILCNFDILCNPLFEMILSNQRENIRLVNLRDILLTKLMKGELDVSNINL